MKKTTCALAAVIIMALPTMLGCGGDPPPPPTTPTTLPPPPPPPPVPPPPPPAPAAPTACDSVMQLGLSTMLKGRAEAEAKGLKAEGAEVCMNVPEGQAATSQVGLMLEPGMCYAVLAQGGTGVTEVELKLLLDLQGAVPPALAALAANPTLAVDSETGASASIGAKGSCYAWAGPIAALAKVTATAKTGTGPIALQVYKKKK